jgi:hypothetical protein
MERGKLSHLNLRTKRRRIAKILSINRERSQILPEHIEEGAVKGKTGKS